MYERRHRVCHRIKEAANRSIYSSNGYLNQQLLAQFIVFSSRRLSKTKTKIRNMIGFLDEVRHDLVLAEAEKKHLQHSIQSLCSQEHDLRDEVCSNEKKVTRIIDMFRQRRIEIEQKIGYCQRQRGEQDEELSRTEHKISW
jgi:hypothetical protein